MAELKQETLTVNKELFEHMLADFECLLTDFEAIAEKETEEKIEKRLKEIRTGKVKGYSENDFLNLMKEEGIDVG